MSVIFPGNYVAHLNAYREQGCVSLPGVEFYRGVGALVLNPDNDSVTTDGTLAAGTYDLQILSPDLRQDDKPRKDRPFVIPEGAVVYRTAVNAPGVREETVGDGVTLTVSGITTPAPVAATAEADGYFNPVGEFSLFASILDGTGLAADTAVTVDVAGGGLIASQKPSAGACRKSPSVIIVEVCYFMPDAVAGYDDVNIPYAVEAGQGY